MGANFTSVSGGSCGESQVPNLSTVKAPEVVSGLCSTVHTPPPSPNIPPTSPWDRFVDVAAGVDSPANNLLNPKIVLQQGAAPGTNFSDVATFLKATGHEVVRLKERMIGGAACSQLRPLLERANEPHRRATAAVWTLFDRAYEACERAFCDENEGLNKARVLEQLIDPNSTWDFILLAHPEKLSIAAGYLIHRGSFESTAFSVAEYVWVDPNFRRYGLGACFVDFVMNELRGEGIDIHFGEIKDPCLNSPHALTPPVTSGVGIDSNQQFAFWRKQGRLLVDTMWPQPALLPGDQESLSEQLTAKPLSYSQPSVSPELLLAVWDAKYGVGTWEQRKALELGILNTRRKLEEWLAPFIEEKRNVSLIPIDQTRQWTLQQRTLEQSTLEQMTL